MNGGAGITTHSIDQETFLAIARGRGGADAVQLLRAGQLSRRLLLLAAVRRAATGPDAALLAASLAELDLVRERSRTEWERLVLLPYLDLWATEVLRRVHGPSGVPVSPQAGTPADLRGLADLIGPWLPDAPAGEPPHLVRLEHGCLRLDLRIDDRGPYREVHGEPLAPALDSAGTAAWEEGLTAAWAVLVRRHPWHAEAIAAGLTTLVPLRPRPDGTAVSSAARRAFGSVALSLPRSPVLLALTLVHEFLHAQLGALLDLVPLHGPDDGIRYHAPWRQDPRPLGALLQGSFAHLGVADFWRTEAGLPPVPETEGVLPPGYAAAEYARWGQLTLEATGTLLSSGRLTLAGTEFTTEMARAIASWSQDRKPYAPVRRA